MRVRNARCASRQESGPESGRRRHRIAPACLGSRVSSEEIMVSRHPRAWSLVALTGATLLLLLGALVARELKGGERPVRLYRLRPEAAG